MEFLLCACLLLATTPAAIAEDSPTFAPAEGFWMVPEEPGSGIAMSFQNTTLVVGLFSYRTDGSVVWEIASGALQGTQFDAELLEFANGSPITDAHVSGEVVAQQLIHLAFVSPQMATLTINGGTPKTLRSFLFGYRSIQTAATPALPDDTFQLPDLAGRWVFVSEDAAAGFLLTLDISEACRINPILDPPPPVIGNWQAQSNDNRPFSVNCYDSAVNINANDPLLTPVCSFNEASADPAATVFSAYLGDIGGERILAYLGRPLGLDSTVLRGAQRILGFRVNSTPSSMVQCP